MKYTVEQIENTYGILVIDGTFMWLEVNNGSSFTDYVMVWDEEGIKSGFKCYGNRSSYTDVFKSQFNQPSNSVLSQMYIYDQENFIRHFGMHFLKF